LVGIILKFLYVWAEGIEHPEADQQNEDEKNQPSFPLSYLCCVTGPALLVLCLAAAKLDDPNTFSAFIIFLPLWIFAGCLCCMFSMVICSVSPEMFERMEEEQRQQQAHLNQAQAGQTGTQAQDTQASAVTGTYGATNTEVVQQSVDPNVSAGATEVTIQTS